MNKNIERISEISAALRLAEIDIDALYAGKNDITPLSAIKLYLEEDSIVKTKEFNQVSQSNNREFIDSLNLSAINPTKSKKIILFERNKSFMDSSGIILKAKKF